MITGCQQITQYSHVEFIIFSNHYFGQYETWLAMHLTFDLFDQFELVSDAVAISII